MLLISEGLKNPDFTDLRNPSEYGGYNSTARSMSSCDQSANPAAVSTRTKALWGRVISSSYEWNEMCG